MPNPTEMSVQLYFETGLLTESKSHKLLIISKRFLNIQPPVRFLKHKHPNALARARHFAFSTWR
jgi:hypothetical protein